MAILNVLRFPDPRLRTVAKEVSEVTPQVQKIIDDMQETMYDEKGVGLAATQVNIHQRIVVMDCSEDADTPIILINPEIIRREGSMQNEEGCLSVPGTYASVERAEFITVKALDRDGESFELEASGLLAICVQHEIDHLDGKLFVDYLSPLKRQRIQKKLEKEAKLLAKEG
ncbi:peptide deformylase [Psychrobium sp. 1_MG-2023]|uniref:peptide deformylase n=1 Tax=Psychrobium sp. 1_MG-2023 TaxID=3062624 RepID=UPI000C334847|nr:peptide deformylase [Psychrobium sp. 1_MG-2023]MDP2560397.1 peptide deformylase [Psychrobium sp. 1_MG-2023]PKF57934.1 peptide deformylase [Alteromonadales bacterium alter-6D02]